LRIDEVGCALLHELRIDSDRDIELPVLQPAASARGCRLAVRIAAGQGNCTVRDLAWVCDLEATQAALLIGICAFADRARAIETARTLAADPSLAASGTRVLVVDQSEASAEPQQGDFRVIRQRNLGGSGGFARIMSEALACATASHLLMLDDDVDIDPEVAWRVRAWCSIAPVHCALAGQMLDMLQPATVHEAGNRFDRQRLSAVPHLRGVRVDQELGLLMTGISIDYGAWFCFAISRAALRCSGLPLPVFINFDDVEFGVRLAGLGIRPTVMPGVGVWHMPGYAKDDDWRAYFYHRNIAVIAAVHGIAGPWSLARRLARRCLRELAHAAPLRLRFACDGTAAFLAGPRMLRADAERDLALIARRRRELGRRSAVVSFCQTVALLIPALAGLLRLLFLGARTARRWRQAYPELTSRERWNAEFAPQGASANQSPAARSISAK
jgi:galactofuranosylgalactofuranosylrhamnosyl-N-acetylglucosaminyl-diphospho-decaprenol beta-1,5/1,6-galactofuranosyltransferase